MAALVVPAALGVLAGYLLGVSAPAYWALQALASVGGLLAGMEHDGPMQGADRGLIGGLLFGSFLLLAHAIAGTAALADLGQYPGFLVVVTGSVSALLGAAGGYLGRRAGSRDEHR